MKQAKYIFLDFDGVLNTGKNIRLLRERHLKTSDGFGPLFDPEAIENLGFILKAIPSAKIVVISSWKDIHGLVGLRDMWFERHLPGSIHSITLTLMHEQILNVNLDDPLAFNGVEGESKGREILAWMAANNALNDPYVIIDDAVGFPPELQPYHVRTDPDAGLTSFDADKAIQILKDMFSMYTEHGYLRARKRQERIAENLSSSNPTEMQINAFLRREERLQAYEFVNCKTGKDAILTVEIDELLLFKVCMKARLAKMAVNDYIEGIIGKAVDE